MFKSVSSRVAALEAIQGDRVPYVVKVFGKNAEPVIPPDIGDRELLVIRIVGVAPPVRDNDGNIIAPMRELDDGDAFYQAAVKPPVPLA